ncbi:MAG: hypothetical protein HY868_09185 [Chloroflexi bacterium]|nr:hypothetical protein [Chloroflexota bacterium]
MEYLVAIEGFEGQHLSLTPQGFFTGSKLLVDGQPAPKGKKRGQFILRRNDGTEIVAQIHSAVLGLDPVPQLVVDGKTIHIAEPFKWYQLLWSGIPILLLFIGGGLGALCGATAFAINARIFRSQKSGAVKYLMTAAVTVASAATFFILAVIATIVLNLVFRK